MGVHPEVSNREVSWQERLCFGACCVGSDVTHVCSVFEATASLEGYRSGCGGLQLVDVPVTLTVHGHRDHTLLNL